jgi:hypothetical protein
MLPYNGTVKRAATQKQALADLQPNNNMTKGGAQYFAILLLI